MNMKNETLLFILLSFVISVLGACSSPDTVNINLPDSDPEKLEDVFGNTDSGTQTDDNQLPLDGFGAIAIPENGFESIPGRELVGELTYDPFVETEGISIHVTNFGFHSSADILGRVSPGDIRITLRLDNQSSTAVDLASCMVNALQDGLLVSDGYFGFAGLGFIDPGKSGVGIIRFFDDLPDGYNSFNELQFDCSWNKDTGTRLDISASTESVEFVGYTISERGYASVNLQRTNNSESEAPILYCTVEARIGNVILDVANVGFPPMDAGAIFETSGLYLSFTSLQGFSDADFDASFWYCEYTNTFSRD